MFPLAKALIYQREQLARDFLSSPFPYTKAYNPYEDLRLESFYQRCQRGEVSIEEFERKKLRETTGTLTLCHEGCGYLHLLVVTGRARGQMWLDGTVSDGGYVPLEVDFLDWYEQWLDNALAGGDGLWWMSEPGE
jgi:hypothetical protein